MIKTKTLDFGGDKKCGRTMHDIIDTGGKSLFFRVHEKRVEFWQNGNFRIFFLSFSTVRILGLVNNVPEYARFFRIFHYRSCWNGKTWKQNKLFREKIILNYHVLSWPNNKTINEIYFFKIQFLAYIFTMTPLFYIHK